MYNNERDADPGYSYHKYCKKCHISYYYGYDIINGKQVPHELRHRGEYWLDSSKTAFSTKFVDRFSSTIYVHKGTFAGLQEQFSAIMFWDMMISDMESIFNASPPDTTDDDNNFQDSKSTETFSEMYENRSTPSRFKLQNSFFQYVSHCLIYELTGNVDILQCPINNVSSLNKYCDFLFPKFMKIFHVKFCKHHLQDAKILNHSHSKFLMIDGHMKCRRQV